MEQATRETRAAKRRAEAKERLRRHGLVLAILLFGSAVWFNFGAAFGAQRSYSDSENRMLTQYPAFSISGLVSGSWEKQTEDAYADQFPGRDGWTARKLTLDRLLGAKESGGVYLCDDDYLIQKPADPDAAVLDRTLEALRGFAARHGDLRIHVAIIPNAAWILADKLPANAPVRDQQADLAALRDGLAGVSFLDVSEALLAHKTEPIYYKTDHHWTSLGAKYAFEAMAGDLGLGEVAVDYQVYTVSRSFEGTLASKSGSHAAKDTVEIYVPENNPAYNVTYLDTGKTVTSLYDRSCLNAKDHYTVFFGGNHPRLDVVTTAATGRTLLLCKDSYANCFVQFLTPWYDKMILVDPRYYYDNLELLIKQEGVTDVLFLYNLDTFQADQSLADVLAE